jgi:hypothetical protein
MPLSSSTSTISPTEIIATIKNSSLFTIVVEGPGDAVVLRKLEEEFLDVGLNLIAAGGRLPVLEVFRRRHELPSTARVIFLADLDLWILSSVPPEYRDHHDLVFTNGHSIENDMFIDGDMRQLMTAAEREKFAKGVEIVCRWYALVAKRHLDAIDDEALDPIDIHPKQLLDDERRRAELMRQKENEQYPDALFERIVGNYSCFLRGKTLIKLVEMHSTAHRYNSNSLLNLAAARRGPNLQAIGQRVRSYLARMIAPTPIRAG